MKCYNRFLVDTEFRDTYNAHLRKVRLKRKLAWLGFMAGALVLAVAFGCLIGLAASPFFSAFAVNAVLAGIWGGYYLLTHH
ncbi:MAG: hypothetical protein KGL39_17650 [Patescibacteria group bacterium]|nr:hypothetical protein [Patescibacteria group bacterium]